MCGVVAVYSEGGTLDRARVTAALETLSHRGPDARRCWFDAEGKVGLGHARLSVIDVAGGHQPIANEDQDIIAVVNGEFYDFGRIRDELRARGHRFRTASDSEIVVHLYEEYGCESLHHLRGEFAFVLWDGRTGRLVCGRDRFGIKPLFYVNDGGTLVVGSEAKALFAAGIAPRWDAESMLQVAWLSGYAAERSLFAGVRQIPPGHYLVASQGSVQLTRYWDFDYPLEPTPRPSGPPDRRVVADLRESLSEAIRLRLAADVPVGCYLSGGIDSCAVLALASRQSPKPLPAFSVSFANPAYDERAPASEMAAACGAEFIPVAVTERDLADDFADALGHAEQPIRNAGPVAKFRLSRAVRDAGIRVVLTGEGADEVLAGYPHFRRDDLLSAHAASGGDPAGEKLAELERRNAASRGIGLPTGEQLPLDGVRRALGFVPTWVEVCATHGFKHSQLLSSEFKALASGRDLFVEMLDTLDVAGQMRGRPAVHQSMYLWSKLALPNTILSVLGDRMEMAHSVEGRVPFLDHPFVEMARSLPVAAKIHDTTEKFVLREAVRDCVPESVYRRPKHPFLAPPLVSEPGGALHELLQATLRGAALDAVPFYDRAKIRRLLDELPALSPAQRALTDPMLMTVLSVCVIGERFKVSAG